MADALTVLIVTVISGVLVWWLTAERQDAFDLEYSIVRTGYFPNEGNSQYFFVATIDNMTSRLASDVEVVISPNNDAVLKEFVIDEGPTVGQVEELADESGRLRIKLDSLRPSEAVKIYLNYESSRAPNLDLTAVSSNAQFRVRQPSRFEKISEEPYKLVGYLVVLVFSSMALRALLLKRIMDGYNTKSGNNSAYIIIHSGHWKNAESIINAELIRGNAEPIFLSNLALFEALRGNIEFAKDLHKSVQLWMGNGARTKNVIALNGALITAVDGDNSQLLVLKQSLKDNSDLAKMWDRSSLVRQFAQ